MKTLSANKVENGWLINIIKTEHIHSESDVLKIIKQEGLKIRNREKDEKGNLTSIFAD